MVDHIHTIGAYEAKTHFSALLAQVESGEEITITRHGVPVAKVVPAGKRKTTPAERKALMDAWLASDRPRLRGLKIKDLIEEGRM